MSAYTSPVDVALGIPGTPLDETARRILSDADAAVTIEQTAWVRRAAMLTPDGVLYRRGEEAPA